MLRLIENVYVTTRQLRVFRDTLQRRHDLLLERHMDMDYLCCLTDLLNDLDDELDERERMSENGS